jgi:hypothetical protein
METEEKSPTEAEGFACCHKILQMIACLHQRGYQQLRVFCYGRMMWWRGEIAPARLFSSLDPACMEPCLSSQAEGLVAHFGSASACDPFGWGVSVISMPVNEMADRFVERFPTLTGESAGRDWEYAGWFQEMLSRASSEKLPVAYAVDEHESNVFDPIRFFHHGIGYSDDTVPLPPVSAVTGSPNYFNALLKSWDELKKWRMADRFAPQNEEDIQSFLYHRIVNNLRTAINVRPKATVIKRRRLLIPDFLVGDEDNLDIAIEIKFSRDGKTGATFEQCLEDIRKLRRLSKHKEFANTKRVFVVVDSRKNQLFLSRAQYEQLISEDPGCHVLCFPDHATAFTESPAKAAHVTIRKQEEEQFQVRSQRAKAAHATIKRNKALSEESRIAPPKGKPAVKKSAA